MTTKLSVKDLPVSGKKVLVRVDFNVPINDLGNISDDSRIAASLPTLRYLIEKNAAIILMSHLGRPKGKKEKKYSLSPCAQRLSELLCKPVQMAEDCIGPLVKKRVQELRTKEILVLENLRFYEAEEKPEKDPNFAKELASFGDLYVNDAFGTSHREHSSTWSIARFFPGKAAAGFLLMKEWQFLNRLNHPEHPFLAIIGGGKVSTKLGVMKSLLSRVDQLLIGGAMAYTFCKAKGERVGNSLVEETFVEEAAALMAQYGNRIILPIDHVIVKEVKKGAESKVVTAKEGIPDGWTGVDVGSQTITYFMSLLKSAATVLWNGPLGIFEVPPFERGTQAIAQGLVTLSAVTVVGGGDSLAALQQAGVSDRITHLSTGGGASLEFIENGILPGIEVLSNFVESKK